MLAEVDRAVRQARGYCDDVEFSAEDATRSDWDYLVEVFRVALEAGARTLNVPDTVGYTQPEEYAALIRFLRERVPGAERAVFSVHCHNDLGLAVANCWRPCAPARARSSAPSTASASAPATPRWKRW